MLETAAESAGRRGQWRDRQPSSTEPGWGSADPAICGSWRLSGTSKNKFRGSVSGTSGCPLQVLCVSLTSCGHLHQALAPGFR